MAHLLPSAAGIGLRAPHVSHVLAERPPVPWFEIHSENYFADGGPALAALVRVRADYPLSMHGVGLSLGSTDPLDVAHLAKLSRLADRVEPASISEHLCWSSVDGRHYNDLLPLPYTAEALDHVCARVTAVQDFLKREILVENVSSYVAFPESTWDEGAFVAAVAARTGCKLLIDVNNIYVNARNHGLDAEGYLAAIPAAAVAEIHLAGFDATGPCLIDTHGTPVAPEVWSLYERALARYGRVPTLIEWDTDIPAFSVLQDEAAKAQSMLESGMPSLRELQARFAGALLMDTGAGERMAIYRNTVLANYRNALGATFPVARQLVGTPFFNAAVDAYVLAFPSTGGDLNVYGDRFGDFLAGYPHAKELPYLPDVARLEWAVDEASRAGDASGTPDAILAALARIPADRITAQRFVVDPSCRFVVSEYPVLRIWHVHQPSFAGDITVKFGGPSDQLVVRREAGAVVVERLAPGDFALLRELSGGGDLAAALEAAMAADPLFDLGTALRDFIANRTLAELRAA